DQVVQDAIPAILKNLEQGIHTIIDFGRYNQLVHYILVANLLTRRIDEQWREKTEKHLADRNHPRPPRIVITIEEAHKFLEPGIADATIFGRIARELRKYNVTLLVVDQRPSQIEPEVLSQIGTKFCCLLDDEKDVQAVLAGTSGAGGLRSVLAALDTRQQALVFGHALPMPVVMKTRTYDEQVWKSAGYQTPEQRRAQADADRSLWEA
ncbi:MAG TPA: ATP-binding protein, partial [Armatimonadota bacterium]|nr:ATP-binding protein [Armatimonadota bacterium]